MCPDWRAQGAPRHSRVAMAAVLSARFTGLPARFHASYLRQHYAVWISFFIVFTLNVLDSSVCSTACRLVSPMRRSHQMALAHSVQIRSLRRSRSMPVDETCVEIPNQHKTSPLQLLVTLPGTSSLNAMRALRRALGAALRIYVVKIDRARTTITLQIETTRSALTDVIGSLAAGLPEATVGRVRANAF